MTIPIHPVIFVLFIFCLLIAIFAIGYAIGHNEGELKSAKEIIILAQMEKARMKDADNGEEKDPINN